MSLIDRSPATQGDASGRESIGAAFRELHGARLHGFALLLTLGDRALAARLSAGALSAAAGQLDELHHPERAAAWLRDRVVRAMPRRSAVPTPGEERVALGPLGADPAVVDGLAAIGTRGRAALIAADIERLDARDVATIVDRHGARLERLLNRARRDYLALYAATPIATDRRDEGVLARRIRAVAARTMS